MIVITGGAGFIGSVLIRELNKAGIDRIVVVDNLGAEGKWRNLSGKKILDVLHKDRFQEKINNRKAIFPIAKIIHLGAATSTTETDAGFLLENNFHYSSELSRFCMENSLQLIVASSAATYGFGELGFSDNLELVPQLKPRNPYAWSKQLFDYKAVAENWTKHISILKFFNVFGPNEYHKGSMRSMVFKAHSQIIEAGQVRLFKSNDPTIADGEQKRDFIYVKDVARVIMWFMEKPQTTGLYNVGTGRARTWNDLARIVFAAMARPADIEYIDMPYDLARGRRSLGGYQNFTEANIDHLRRAGYEKNFLDLEESITDYVNNYLEKDDPYY